MRAPYGRWVVLLRERGCEGLWLTGFPSADSAAPAYRPRADALSPDVDSFVAQPPGYEGRGGEPMVLLPMLRFYSALAEVRQSARGAYLSGRRGGRQRRALHRSVWIAGVAGRKRRHIDSGMFAAGRFCLLGRRARLLA
jgi:hypothetical protein